MPRFHHVNLGVPVDGIDDESTWLVDILGYQRLDPGGDLAAMGACWFETEDGSQVHLSRDPEHRPAARAHVALEFDDLGPVERRLTEQGRQFSVSDRPEMKVLFCQDPAGNRWELRQHAS
jgi:catechol 2,3-dioxygenase-like lactoylglutathione lyase family enzyme